MLLLLTGSSAAGKTTAGRSCIGLDRLEVHDSDERGVPEGADAAWRQQDLEAWVRLAVELDQRGTDLLLTAQSPLGEVLAAPGAPGLDVAVCLLDVADDERRRRLVERDAGRWSTATTEAFLGWARCHCGHAADPRHRPEVITTGSWPSMAWARWTGWTAADPRWHVEVVDTTGCSPAQTAAAVRAWVHRARGERDAGVLPLRRGVLDHRPGEDPLPTR